MLAGGTTVALSPFARALDSQDLLMFSKGPVSLRPQLSVSETYSDNIYYEDTNPTGDLITIVSPGLKLQLGQDFADANIISLAYNLDQFYYADRNDQNATQQRFRLTAQYFPSRFQIKGSDRLEFLSSVLSGGFSTGGLKVDRTQMVDSYSVTYGISEKTAVYVEGLHSSIDYQDDVPLFDTRTITGTLGFEWKTFERTKLFGEAYYGQTTLNKNARSITPPHANFVGGFLGARGDFTERITGTVKAGFEVRDFSDGSKAGSSPVVEVAATYRPTEKTAAILGFSRRQQVSVQFVRASYVADAVSLEVQQLVGSTGRFRLNAGGSFDFLSYDPSLPNFASRNDTMWSATLGASYSFETWLALRLSYSLEQFRSDLPVVVDYDVNRVTVSLSVGY